MHYDKFMLKRFIGYYRKYRGLFFTDLLCALLVAAIELIYPRVTTVIIDEYIPQGLLTQILIAAAVLLGLYILMAGLNYFLHYWGHIIGVNMEADMRADFFAYLIYIQY